MSVPFSELCRYTGHEEWPRDVQPVVDEERDRYRQMCDFVGSLGSDWFLFTYEDMVNRNFTALNRYLGFEVQADTEVPESTGKAKVVRKKASGDWRHWFTEEDISLFRSAYLPYMERVGYDCNDWMLSPDPVIEPEYASVYMQNLAERVPLDVARKLRNRAKRLFSRKAG